MDAIVLKLGHPLEEVRVRSLRSIHTKISTGLWPHAHCLPEKIQQSLLDLLPPLATDYTQAQEILSQLQSVNRTPQHPPAEPAIHSPRVFSPSFTSNSRPSDAKPDDGAKVPHIPPGVHAGWTYSHVDLADADDQMLFEFEVKLKMHGGTQEGLRLFMEFGETLLRDFPAEVFLQRPAILQFIMHLLQVPLIELTQPPASGFGEALFGYKKLRRHDETALFFVLLDLLQSLVDGLATSFQLHVDATYHTHVCEPPTPSHSTPHRSIHAGSRNPPSYPCAAPSPDGLRGDSWSYSGAMCYIFTVLASLMARPSLPRLRILSVMHSLVPSLHDVSATTIEPFESQRLAACFSSISDALDVMAGPREDGSMDNVAAFYTWRLLLRMLAAMGCPSSALISLLPPRIVHALETLVLDQALFEVDPSIRHHVLPIAILAKPAISDLLEHHIHVTNVIQNWQSFVEAVDGAIDGTDPAPTLPQDALTLLSVMDHIPRLEDRDEVVNAVAKMLPSITQDDQVVAILEKLLQCPTTISSRFDHVVASLSRRDTRMNLSAVVLCLCRRLVATPPVDALWQLLHLVLHDAGHDAIPFLQHWAYADVPLSSAHRQMQPALAARLIDLQHAEFTDTVLAIARCLLHTSEFVRRSAAVGLVSALVDDDSFVDPRNWMVQNDFHPGDPFDALAHSLRDHVLSHPLPQPPTRRPSTRITSVFTSVQKFVAILTSPSLEWNIKESVLHQVIQVVRLLDADTAAALATSGELSNVLQAVVPFLSHPDTKFHLLPLVLLRDLVMACPDARQFARSSTVLHVVLPFVFSSNMDVRAGAYLVVLFLTCAPEVWGDSPVSKQLQVPSMITSSFGIHSAMWASWGISTYNLSTSLLESPEARDATSNDGPGTVLSQPPLAFITDAIHALNGAGSHRDYLNKMYPLDCMARLDATLTGSAISSQLQSKSTFLRILHTTPSSWRDEAALASLFHVLQHVVPILDVSDLLYILVAIKTNAVPLLHQANQSYGGALHVKVLALLVAIARRDDMVEFVAAFLLETQLHETLRRVYVLGDDSSAQAIALRLLYRVLVHSRSCLDLWNTDQLAPTLVQLVGEYHPSDSFIRKDATAWALSCLVAIAAHTPWTTHSTTNRFLFDRDSRLRAMGYALLPPTDSTYVELAQDTVVDMTECSKVRVQAAQYVLRSPLDSLDVRYLTKLIHVVENTPVISSEVLFAVVSLVQQRHRDLLPLNALDKLASVAYHHEAYKRLSRAVMGISISDTSPATSCFKATWAAVHRPTAIECIRVVLSEVSPTDGFGFLPRLNEIFSLTCDDSRPYVQLLGVAVRFFSRMMDHVTVDQHEEMAHRLVAKLVGMVQRDESVLSACHVIYHCAKHPSWKTLLQTPPGQAISNTLVRWVIDKPRHVHHAQVAAAVQSVLESHPTFFIDDALKQGLLAHCLTKLTGHLALTADETSLLCRLIRAQVGYHVEAKQLANDLHLPALFASMWHHIQASPRVVQAWLEAINNYVYQSQPAKQSIVGSPCDSQSSCLRHLLHHATSPKPTHVELTFAVLKSVALNGECVLAMIKYGYVAKLMGTLATLVYKYKQTKLRADAPPMLLRSVLDVVVNISFSPDGRTDVCRFAHLQDLLTDLVAAPALVEPTALLLRNISFTSIAKAQFLHWKPIMTALRTWLPHDDPFVCNFASTAIWSLVYNNQKATTKAMTEFDWSTCLANAAASLERALAAAPMEPTDRMLLTQAQVHVGYIAQLLQCNAGGPQSTHADQLAVQVDTNYIRRDRSRQRS